MKQMTRTRFFDTEHLGRLAIVADGVNISPERRTESQQSDNYGHRNQENEGNRNSGNIALAQKEDGLRDPRDRPALGGDQIYARIDSGHANRGHQGIKEQTQNQDSDDEAAEDTKQQTQAEGDEGIHFRLNH
jgi:hypothetical protein